MASGSSRKSKFQRYDVDDINLKLEENAQLLFSDDENGFVNTTFEISDFVNRKHKEDCVKSYDRDLKSFTVEDAVEKAGFGVFQIKIILILGILSASDAMEMLLLAILGPVLRCEWYLSSYQVAFITTVVFTGYLVSAPFWGMLADKYGRWTGFFIVLNLIAYFGFLTAFSPTYPWVVFLRGVVGIGIGGGATSFTLMSEYLPMKFRAKTLIFSNFSWALGSSFEIFLASIIVPKLGWRWLVAMSSLPAFSFIFLMMFVPESARYLLTSGKKEEALQVLTEMCKLNSVSMPKGDLVCEPVTVESRGNMKHLFLRQYRTTSLVLFIGWFGAAFSYYGSVLLSSEIFRFHAHCYAGRSTLIHHNKTVTYVDTSCCRPLSTTAYSAMLLSSLGEFAVIPVNMYLVDGIGRRFTMALSFGVCAFFFVMLYVCVPAAMTTFSLFVLRAFASGCFNTLYIYTCEFFPTTIRSLAVGLFSAFARFGSMSTPFVAQVILADISVFGALFIYAFVASICTISSLLLPIETLGRSMPETVVCYNVKDAKLSSNDFKLDDCDLDMSDA